jgi:hypothetical protein
MLLFTGIQLAKAYGPDDIFTGVTISIRPTRELRSSGQI